MSKKMITRIKYPLSKPNRKDKREQNTFEKLVVNIIDLFLDKMKYDYAYSDDVTDYYQD